MRRTVLLLLAVAAIAFAWGTARAGDQIILSDGKVFRPEQTNLQVTAETYDKVKWKSGGIEGSLDQDQVKEVRWADKPDAYRNGEVNYKRGEYDRAADFFKEALNGRKGRDWWVNPYSLYYLASSLAKTGKLNDAEDRYKEFIEQYPEAKFAPNAYVELGDVYLALGQPSKALENYKVITEAVDPITLLPKYGNRIYQTARSKIADAQIALKDYNAALKTLSDLLDDIKGKMPQLALLVEQKKAHVMVLQGDLQAGVKAYNEIIDRALANLEGADAEAELELYAVMAQCYNGLGDAYRSKNQYKDALIQYLRIITVLADSAPAEYPHALAGAAKCFKEIGMEDRAKELETELNQRFPDFKL